MLSLPFNRVKTFTRLTSSCILRVLPAPPIPPRALPGANILGMNSLNYETCIEKFENIQVFKFVSFEHTQFFGEFNNQIKVLSIFLKSVGF